MSDRMPTTWRPANYGGSVEGPQSAALNFVTWVLQGIPCVRCRAEWVVRNLPRSAGMFGIDDDTAGAHDYGAGCPMRFYRQPASPPPHRTATRRRRQPITEGEIA